VSVSGTLEDISNTNSTALSSNKNNTSSVINNTPKNQSIISSKDKFSKSKIFANKSLPVLTQQVSYSNNGNTAVSPNNSSAREYVESLHQNSKSQLIYGKNHVIVVQKDRELAGYLSLHLNTTGLILKWTPNQLMNSNDSQVLCDESQQSQTLPSAPPPTTSSSSQQNLPKTQSGYWEYAMYVDMNTIVYLHCHQQTTLVLVAPDGVQHPPIKFPKGSHLLQFLTCLENGLAPHGQLDPPLWNEIGKGKVFPKLHRRSTTKDYNKKLKLASTEKKGHRLSLTTEQNENCDLSDNEQKDTTLASTPINTEINRVETASEDVIQSDPKNNAFDSTSENSLNVTENVISDDGGGDDDSLKEVDDFVFRIINLNSNGKSFMHNIILFFLKDFKKTFNPNFKFVLVIVSFKSNFRLYLYVSFPYQLLSINFNLLHLFLGHLT
jgi:hypothetical protein